MNSHLKNTVINNNLRLIEMDETNRPLIYTAADIGKLTSTDNFFARKFDGDVDTSILDFIDSVIDKPLKQTKKAS